MRFIPLTLKTGQLRLWLVMFFALITALQTTGIAAHEFADDGRKALEAVLRNELKDEPESVKNGIRLKFQIAHSKPGDVIELEPGTYTLKLPTTHNVDRFFHYEGNVLDLKINHDLTIRGKSTDAADTIIDWEGTPLAERVAKGLFVIREAKRTKTFPDPISVTIENLTFKDSYSFSNNGAGIRAQGASLTVRNCRFIKNQNGILFTGLTDQNPLSPSYYEGELIVEDSYFESNGEFHGDLSHGIYLSKGNSLTVRNSHFKDTKRNGHHIKSLAASTIVTGSHFSNKNAEITYNIDTPNGGDVTITDNQFDYYDAADGEDNRNMFTFASIQPQNDKEPGALTAYIFKNNTINNYHSKGIFALIGDDAQSMMELCGNTVNNLGKKPLNLKGLKVTKPCPPE